MSLGVVSTAHGGRKKVKEGNGAQVGECGTGDVVLRPLGYPEVHKEHVLEKVGGGAVRKGTD